VKLVFLISLPRSGSTLLQRLLMGHSQIATCGEPWLALPIALMDRRYEGFSTYGHFSLNNSVTNLYELLPGGREQFLSEGGNFITSLYEKISPPNKAFFLDKTPRYYKIIPELKLMFPQAKFLYMTREPISVYASILNYIDGKMYRLPTWRQDIVEGMHKLSFEIDNLDSNSYLIRYEDLVADPTDTLSNVLDFLGLSFEPDIIDRLNQRNINLGDPSSGKKYDTISRKSIHSWKTVINSKTKRAVGMNWLKEVPESCFLSFNTSKSEELKKFDSLKPKTDLRNIASWLTGATYFYGGLNVVRWGFKRRKEKLHSAVY